MTSYQTFLDLGIRPPADYTGEWQYGGEGEQTWIPAPARPPVTDWGGYLTSSGQFKTWKQLEAEGLGKPTLVPGAYQAGGEGTSPSFGPDYYAPSKQMLAKYAMGEEPDEGFLSGLFKSVGSTLSDPGLQFIAGAAGLGAGLNALTTPAAVSAWEGPATLAEAVSGWEGPAAAAETAINPLTGLPDEQFPAPVETRIPGELPGTSGTLSTLLSKLGIPGTLGTLSTLGTLGNLGVTALSALEASEQSDAFERLAEQYAGYGAPYREKLAGLYADPSAFLTSPEVMEPVNQATKSLAQALSVSGNPYGNPSSQFEIENYAANKLFGLLGQEKDRLGGFGGLSAYNQAAPQISLAAADKEGGIFGALGYGLEKITNPEPTLTDLLKRLGFKTSAT